MSWFHRFAHAVSLAAGSPYTFAACLFAVFIWGLSGPHFGFSDTWQLVINTSTTIVTFLMVFLIQNTQNRESRALHLKLDELIRVSSHARNQLIDIEDLSDKELDRLHEELCHARDQIEERIDEVKQEKKVPNA